MSAEANCSLPLLDDVFSYVLYKLPIKSIIVCTCVSKAWNSFIKSRSFVLSHLNHTITSYKENNAHLCLLQLCSGETDCFSLRSDDQDFSHHARLHFPYKHKYGFQVRASCNGLVCLMEGKSNSSSRLRSLFLWNPIIRKSLIIHESINCSALEAVGLGFDSRTDEYKVLTIIKEGPTLKVELYSLKSNCWKRLADVEASEIWRGTPDGTMTFLNGVLHFVAIRQSRKPGFLILGFDLSDEVFSEIMLPDCITNDDFWDFRTGHSIWACGESLSLLCYSNTSRVFQIWVMKEYGVEGSWTKLSTFSLQCFSLSDEVASCSVVGGLVFRNNGHVILGFRSCYSSDAIGQIYSLDPKSQETKALRIDGKHVFIFVDSYAGSLILLDKGNDLGRLFEIESCNANAMRYVYKSGDEGSGNRGEDSEETSSGYSSGEAGDGSSQAPANED